MIRVTIISVCSYSILLITFGTLLELGYIKYEPILSFIIPSSLVLFTVAFILSIKRTYKRETLILEDRAIKSNTFGHINFHEIRKHKIVSFRGFASLIITMKNGEKITIGPNNNFSVRYETEFQNFLDGFKKKL